MGLLQIEWVKIPPEMPIRPLFKRLCASKGVKKTIRNFVRKTFQPLRNELRGEEVIHSPGLPLLAERRHSGAMDNFQCQ